jgi:hypothetical protein
MKYIASNIREGEYEYALRFPNGLYYTGRANSESEPNAWQGELHQAFTYTEEGAYYKKYSLDCFSNTTVVRVL